MNKLLLVLMLLIGISANVHAYGPVTPMLRFCTFTGKFYVIVNGRGGEVIYYGCKDISVQNTCEFRQVDKDFIYTCDVYANNLDPNFDRFVGNVVIFDHKLTIQSVSPPYRIIKMGSVFNITPANDPR